mgnify:CR=1 FL=1
MGLFWSLQPASDRRQGIWLMKKDVTTPLIMKLSVHNEQGETIATESCERWFLAPKVKRISIRHGRLRGTLFIPEGTEISVILF